MSATHPSVDRTSTRSGTPRRRRRDTRGSRSAAALLVVGLSVAGAGLVPTPPERAGADSPASISFQAPPPDQRANPPASRPDPDPAPDPALAARDAFAASGVGGTIAVLVTGGAPGRSPNDPDVGWLPDRPFATASLVKLYLAEGLLHRARATGAALSVADSARVAAMLSSSDDDAASRLWVDHGGPAVLADVAARYQLSATSPPTTAGAWGQSTTSARDLARFLTTLPETAHPDDVRTMWGPLSRDTAVAADGFDQRFGLLADDLVPPGSPVKQGWMCCVDDVRHLHSVGVVGDRVVVLLTAVPAAVTWAALRSALAAAAAATTDGH